MGADEITTAEAARILQVGNRTVVRWADTGKLPKVRTLPSGHRRYNRAVVEALGENMKAQNRIGQPPPQIPADDGPMSPVPAGHRPSPRRRTRSSEAPMRQIPNNVTANVPAGVTPNPPRIFEAGAPEPAQAEVQTDEEKLRAHVLVSQGQYKGFTSVDGRYYAFRVKRLYGSVNDPDDRLGPEVTDIHRALLTGLAVQNLVGQLAMREIVLGGEPNVVYQAFGMSVPSLGKKVPLWPIDVETLAMSRGAVNLDTSIDEYLESRQTSLVTDLVERSQTGGDRGDFSLGTNSEDGGE